MWSKCVWLCSREITTALRIAVESLLLAEQSIKKKKTDLSFRLKLLFERAFKNEREV